MRSGIVIPRGRRDELLPIRPFNAAELCVFSATAKAHAVWWNELYRARNEAIEEHFFFKV